MSSFDKFLTFVALVIFLCFGAVVALQALEWTYYKGTGPWKDKVSGSVWAQVPK